MTSEKNVPPHRMMPQEAKDPTKANERLDSLVTALTAKRILTLVVEPSSNCNLTCRYCDLHSGRIPNVDRYKGQMTLLTWKRLVDQIESLGYKLKQLQLHGNGEPLLNKRLAEFIDIARHRDVAEIIRVTTNGTALIPSVLEKIVAAGVHEIRISVDAGEAETWERFKGKELFAKLRNNLINAIEYVSKRPSVRLVLKYPVVGKDQSLSYDVTDYFGESVINAFSSYISTENVVLSAMPVVTLMDGVLLKKEKFASPCEIPFYSLFVKFDGRVSVCCADVTNLLDLGSVNEDGLPAILKGAALREFRMKHLNSEFDSIPLCMYCGNRTSVNLETVADTVRSLIRE